jgi:hypothetical protein
MLHPVLLMKSLILVHTIWILILCKVLWYLLDLKLQTGNIKLTYWTLWIWVWCISKLVILCYWHGNIFCIMLIQTTPISFLSNNLPMVILIMEYIHRSSEDSCNTQYMQRRNEDRLQYQQTNSDSHMYWVIHYTSYDWLHGAEPFLRSCQFCSYSRISLNFVEPEGLLPRSQEPSTCSYPETDRSGPYCPIYLSRIHLNIIHSHTAWSS